MAVLHLLYDGKDIMPLYQLYMVAVKHLGAVVIQNIHAVVVAVCVAVKIAVQLLHALKYAKVMD